MVGRRGAAGRGGEGEVGEGGVLLLLRQRMRGLMGSGYRKSVDGWTRGRCVWVRGLY